MLRHHVELIHALNLRLLIRAEASGVANQPANKKGKAKETARERDDPQWSIGAVWETVQIEVQVALQEILFSSAGGPSQALKLSSSSSSSSSHKANASKVGAHVELTFSFDDSNAPSIARMSRGKEEKTAYERQLEARAVKAAQKAELLAIVPSSPYNVAVLYRPVLAFTQQVQGIVQPRAPAGSGGQAPVSQLMGFLSMYLHSSFLPRLQADVNIEVDGIFADSHAFDAIEAPHAVSSRAARAPRGGAWAVLSPVTSSSASAVPLRLRCVLAVSELLDQLLLDVPSLPHSVAEYVELMGAVITRLTTHCNDRYTEVCRGAYSATRLLDTQLRQGMEQETSFRAIVMQQQAAKKDDGTATAASAFSAAHPLYAPFFSPDFALRADQLMTDPRALTDVCLMAESLEWLSDHLYQHCQLSLNAVITQGTSSASTGRRRAKERSGGKKDKAGKGRTRAPVLPEVPPSPSHTPAASAPLPSFRLDESHALDDVGRVAPSRSSPTSDAVVSLIRGLLPLCSALLGLSTRSLLTLRFELHCQLHHFLSHFRHSSYALQARPTEPELWVTALTASLSAFDDTVRRLTGAWVRRYVEDGLFALVGGLVVRFVGLLHDRRMTREGVHQLHIDVFALHQCVVGLRVDGGDEDVAEGEAFDRAVYYLDLLLLSEEDLLSADHSQHFTGEEIKAITQLTRTQHRSDHTVRQ